MCPKGSSFRCGFLNRSPECAGSKQEKVVKVFTGNSLYLGADGRLGGDKDQSRLGPQARKVSEREESTASV